MSLPERREVLPAAAAPPASFRPFIPAEVKLPELTVLGAVFGASRCWRCCCT